MVGSRGQSKRRWNQGAVGAVLLGVGALLLVVTGAYFAYGVWVRSNLDDLNVTRSRPAEIATAGPSVEAAEIREVPVTAGAAEDSAAPPISTPKEFPAEVGVEAPASNEVDGATEAPSEVIRGSAEGHPGVAAVEMPAEEAPPADIVADIEEIGPEATSIDTQDDTVSQSAVVVIGSAGADSNAAEASVFAPLDPGSEIRDATTKEEAVVSLGEAPDAAAGPAPGQEPAFEDPRAALIAEAIEASKDEAAMYSAPSLADLKGGLAPATRIRIPAINLDSAIEELTVDRTAESAAWETPKHVVGHIPTTAVAGEQGQGWYFGHLESPIKREGNVFRRLPEIAGLLDPQGQFNDEPIYIFVESEGRKFVYQAYATTVVPQEDLRITDSGAQDITLVTCTPRFFYDQRLLVTAALVGVLGT